MGVFLEILEWFDESGEEMAHRLPQEGSADIKFGAQLIVRESQDAIFWRDGKAHDHFASGRHTLSSKNLPLITQALSLPWGFTSPFRCEVYFISRKTFVNLKWGTREPVVFRDAKLGLVRLRAFGQTSFRIADAKRFINTMVGTRASFTTHDATDYLRDVIVARLNDYLGENLATIFDLPAIYDETGAALGRKLAPDFEKYGLALEDFFITAITPPEEVAQMVDSQGSLALANDLPRYLQYQVARSLSGGGGQPQGNPMLDAGIGLGLGMLMPSLLGGVAALTAPCKVCQAAMPQQARFCAACGAPREGSEPAA
jgi:membrane protease subunit (stomatin/prohibitin family)